MYYTFFKNSAVSILLFIYRSEFYLHLLLINARTIEGKCHVNALPITLVRSQNDQHKMHIDTNFAKASIRYLENLSSLVGSEEVCFLWHDNKARVPMA